MIKNLFSKLFFYLLFIGALLPVYAQVNDLSDTVLDNYICQIDSSCFYYYLTIYSSIDDKDSNLIELTPFSYSDYKNNKFYKGSGHGLFLPTIPFFNLFPLFKIKTNYGFLVCAHYSYRDYYNNMDFISFRTFDLRGNMISQLLLPYFFLESFPDDGNDHTLTMFSGILFSHSIIIHEYLEVKYYDSNQNEKKNRDIYEIKTNGFIQKRNG